ncbi:hypothetical protein NXW71_17075 [Parabacteroides merdae]|nr:hypothetical protein [Parabacteroides merdae]
MIFEMLIIAFLMVVAIVLILLEIFMLPGITVAGVGGFLFAAGGLFYAYSVSTPIGNVTLAVSSLVFAASFILVVAFQILQPGGFENRHRFQAGIQPRLGNRAGRRRVDTFTPRPNREGPH